MKFNHNKLKEIAKPLPETERRAMEYQIKHEDELLAKLAKTLRRPLCSNSAVSAFSTIHSDSLIASERKVVCKSIKSLNHCNVSASSKGIIAKGSTDVGL